MTESVRLNNYVEITISDGDEHPLCISVRAAEDGEFGDAGEVHLTSEEARGLLTIAERFE